VEGKILEHGVLEQERHGPGAGVSSSSNGHGLGLSTMGKKTKKQDSSVFGIYVIAYEFYGTEFC
jgi:hypothetical protein